MEPPNEADCCNSGCNPCILEVYDNYLKKEKKTNNTELINAISETSYTKFLLKTMKEVAPSVYIFSFDYADVKHPNCVKYNSGQYFLLRGKDNEGEFTRAYTPIPLITQSLGFTVLVRIYPIGRMSKILKKLKIGDLTFWRGPYGNFEINYDYRYLFFIAQGTGIAPVFTIITEIMKTEDCESFVKLFYCCRDSDNILLREELYELGCYWNFNYEVFLSNSEKLVTKYNEIINPRKLQLDDIYNYLNAKENKQVQVIICGSEQFNENIEKKVLELGIDSNQIYLF